MYGLADDATVLTAMEVGSLSHIKDILVSFGNISGLECNVEKTILMQVGSDLPIEQNILNLGFDVKNEITLLGLVIEGDTGSFEKSFNKITQSIAKEKNFWLRFNLSLPGRIAIAKYMLYSQINYLGSFLPVDEIRIQQWSEMIEGTLKYCKKSKVYLTGTGRVGPF